MKEPIHVIPTNDLLPHTEKQDCGCRPTIEEYQNAVLVIHNSFDGREAVEQANQILDEENRS